MNHASHSDLDRMGLAHYQPYQSAFDAVPPRGEAMKPYTGPKKTGPKLTKVQQAAISLETPEERRERQKRGTRALDQQGRATVDLEPRKTGAITIGSKSDAARNTQIRHGRAI